MMTRNYGWKSEKSPTSCNYVVPAILRILRELNARRVLDLGAGNGSLCRVLSEMGYEVVGVEPDSEGIKIARRRCPRVKFYRLDVDSAPDQILWDFPGAFDVVVSTEVLEHLYYPRLLAAFARNLIHDTGSLVITTPYHGYAKNLAISLLDGWDRHANPLWDGGHIKLFSRKTITRLLEETGFDVVQFGGIGRLPLLWKSMYVVAVKRINRKIMETSR